MREIKILNDYIKKYNTGRGSFNKLNQKDLQIITTKKDHGIVVLFGIYSSNTLEDMNLTINNAKLKTFIREK